MVKEPVYRFMYDMCLAYQKLPSDPFWEEMDPIEKLLMFQSWAYKNEVQIDQLKEQAILIGSFSNYEMAKRMSKRPDVSLTDEEEQQSIDIVRRSRENALNGINNGKKNSKKKRKVLKNG